MNSAVQEFAVRVPKNTKKRYGVMNFRTFSNVDASKWSNAQMERENNTKDPTTEQSAPKSGAGSEFGRDRREQARKMKYGKSRAGSDPESQPWILQPNGKGGKKFRGTKQGGINDNSDYYVFIKASDGAFEAFPVEDWYNFTNVPQHKTLDHEQAEVEFEKREKILNYFKVMKKTEVNDETLDGEKGNAKIGRRGARELKIKDGENEFGRDSDEDLEEDGAPKRKKVATKKPRKEKDEEMDENDESGESDGEGVEVDYISDSDGEVRDDPTNMMKGDDERDETDESDEEKKENVADVKSPLRVEVVKSSSSGSSCTSGSDSDDFDDGFKSALFVRQSKDDVLVPVESKKLKSSAQAELPVHSEGQEPKPSSQTDVPISTAARKRKRGASAKPKKSENIIAKTDVPVPIPVPSQHSEFEAVEATIRGMLMRRPMTTTEVVRKIGSIKGVPKGEYVSTLAAIIKRVKPKQKLVDGKMHLYLDKR